MRPTGSNQSNVVNLGQMGHTGSTGDHTVSQEQSGVNPGQSGLIQVNQGRLGFIADKLLNSIIQSLNDGIIE